MLTASVACWAAERVLAQPVPLVKPLTLQQELQALGVPVFRTRAIRRYQCDTVWKIRARSTLPLLPVLWGWGFLIALVLLPKLGWTPVVAAQVILSLFSVFFLRFAARWETVPWPWVQLQEGVDPEVRRMIEIAQRVPGTTVEVDQLQTDPIVWVRRGRERVPIGFWQTPGIESYNP